MPFVPVPDTFLVELRMTCDLQQVENTLWFDVGETPNQANMSDTLDAVFGWWKDEIAPLLNVNVELRELVATDMSSATGPQVAFTPTTDNLGALSEELLPNNVSLTVSFRTAQRGRSFRGRNYVVGLSRTQINASTVIEGVVDGFQAGYQNLIAAAGIVGATWVVASRFSGVNPTTGKPIPRTTGIATPITTVVVVDPFVDSQRRRLPTRGN
jgi:hypothetical protein